MRTTQRRRIAQLGFAGLTGASVEKGLEPMFWFLQPMKDFKLT